MKYMKMTNEQLQQCKYPNLIAEIIESGYSICTLAEHMGLQGRRKENDPEVLGKIRGSEDLLMSEASGLSRLYGVSVEYLFADDLKMVCDCPVAHWRWYDWNRRIEKEMQHNKFISEMERQLRDNPYLCEFMKVALTWSESEIQAIIDLMKKETVAV